METTHIVLEIFFIIGSITMISSITYHLVEDIIKIIRNKYI